MSSFGELPSEYRDGLIIIFDDAHWIAETVKQLKLQSPDLPVTYWLATELAIDPDVEPPRALFFAFCSASAGQRQAPNSFEAFRVAFAWLTTWGRRVVNGGLMEMEGSKAEQIRMCRKVGLPIPRTVISGTTKASVLRGRIPEPFILKPDRGGSGAGVRLFDSIDELEAESKTYLTDNPSPTGLYLYQEFLDRQFGFYRAEFVGGKFLYLAEILVDPTNTGFNMCPCANKVENYRITRKFNHAIRRKMEEFIRTFSVENVAFEFICNASGEAFVIDINSNTSFNVQAEEHHKAPSGFKTVANYLLHLLCGENAGVLQSGPGGREVEEVNGELCELNGS